MSACPTKAVQRRTKDGIVFIEAALCIGCKSCLAACPWGAPQWDPVSKKAVKCDYCKDRLDVGLKPACVTKCLTGCLSFGNADEIQSGRRARAATAVAGIPAAARG
jgi:Fe-S-cluster-containing dehydrogenase component